MTRFKDRLVPVCPIMTICLCWAMAIFSPNALAWGFGKALESIGVTRDTVVGKIANGDIEGVANDCVKSVEKIGKSVAEIVQDPSILLDIAEFVKGCTPAAVAAYAGQYQLIIADFANRGSCTQLVSVCNKKFGDFACPNIDGIRDRLVSACGASALLGNFAGDNEAAQGFVSMCQNHERGSYERSDEVFGTSPTSESFDVAAEASQGEAGSRSAILKHFADEKAQQDQILADMAYSFRHSRELDETTKQALITTLSTATSDFNETIRQITIIGGENVRAVVDDARNQRESFERIIAGNQEILNNIVQSSERQIERILRFGNEQFKELSNLNREQFNKFIELNNEQRKDFLASMKDQGDRFLEITKILEKMASEGKKVDFSVINQLFSRLDAVGVEKKAILAEKAAEISRLTEQYNASLTKADAERKKAADALSSYVNSLARQVVTASLVENACQSYLAKMGKCARFPSLDDCADVSLAGYSALCSK